MAQVVGLNGRPLPRVTHTPGEPIRNTEFAIRGINHLALVCGDLNRTVDFYTDVLGMPLVKILTLGNNRGYHFFFGLGNGDTLAFFWYADAPAAAPGVAAPGALPGKGESITAVGSMNHVAFNVPAEKFIEYRDRLVARGIEITELMHDESESTIAAAYGPEVWVRSFYFQDPDGILLEFAAWTNAGTNLETDQSTDVISSQASVIWPAPGANGSLEASVTKVTELPLAAHVPP